MNQPPGEASEPDYLLPITPVHSVYLKMDDSEEYIYIYMFWMHFVENLIFLIKKWSVHTTVKSLQLLTCFMFCFCFLIFYVFNVFINFLHMYSY